LAGAIKWVIAAWTGGWLKLILIAVVIGGGLWWFRLWLNKHDDGVFKQGRDQAVQTMTKDFESRLQVELAGAKAMADTAAKDRAAVDARLDTINVRFGTIFAELGEINQAVKDRQVIYVEKAAAVPAAGLDPALRAISNDIAGRAINR
jgi:hypothetical protein